MSHPQTNAKFKGKCPKCEKEYAAGVIIYKINEEYWCADANCQGPPENRLEHDVGGEPPKISRHYREVHDEVWGFAIEEAKKVYPVEMRQVPGDENLKRDINQIARMILSQVFYKKLMDWHIHHG